MLGKINQFRRFIMLRLSKTITKSNAINEKNFIKKKSIKKILISRPNHRLGNQLLMIPIVDEAIKTFPHAKLDIFAKGGLSPILFQNHQQVDRFILLPKKHFKQLLQYFGAWIKIKSRRYDLVINVDEFSSSGRLSTKFASAKYKCFGDDFEDQGWQAQFEDAGHIAKHPVYNFRSYLKHYGIEPSKDPILPIDIRLSKTELKDAKEKLLPLIDNNKPTICIFTFATADKCYSTQWWDAMYSQLLEDFPECNIVEALPVENVSQIDFKAPAFYSKDVRELSAFIANTQVFLGADSGIMHLASASRSPVLGLFSRSNTARYEPYDVGRGVDTNVLNYEDISKLVRDGLDGKL